LEKPLHEGEDFAYTREKKRKKRRRKKNREGRTAKRESAPIYRQFCNLMHRERKLCGARGKKPSKKYAEAGGDNNNNGRRGGNPTRKSKKK